uniref:Raptor N-terminal CASPase-like domain-containing protein n=1 Tax=Trypanosoma congolense (strain IL3000) TaxID=1068625 RepID=G0UJ06_TRYCI|nr:conserved hypothetical protein [Trypanosoma congolense IL3000]
MNSWLRPLQISSPSSKGVPLSAALELRTDAEVEVVERRRWGRLVQEIWFRRGRRVPFLGVEPPTAGESMRVTPVPSGTAAVALSVNINPELWAGEGDEDREEGCFQALGEPYVFGWRSLGLLPGDNFNILGELGMQLERCYQSLSKRSLVVSHNHNNTGEGLRRALMQGRQEAGKREKVVFHYGGYGVPWPRPGGMFFMSSDGRPVMRSTDALFAVVGLPLVVIADCGNAREVLRSFLRSQRRHREPDCNVGDGLSHNGPFLWSSSLDFDDDRGHTSLVGQKDTTPLVHGTHDASTCVSPTGAGGDLGSNEAVIGDFFFLGATCSGALPQHPKLPSDIFTSCLVTPLRMALLWFLVENDSMVDIHPLLPFLIPGTVEDKKTPLGRLQWAFMSITECIAWSSLPYETFVHLFREDVVLAPLFRGFLVAERIITALGGEVCVYPPLPRMGNHSMWDSLDSIFDRTFVSLKRAVFPAPSKTLTTLEFREWLDWNVTRWRCEQYSTSLPSLGDRPVVVPDFLEEELRCLMAVTECVTKQDLPLCRDGSRERRGVPSLSSLEGACEDHECERRAFSDPTLEVFLDESGPHGRTGKASLSTKPFPMVSRLPMLLQGLLVTAHRDEAVRILCRFIDAGPPAVTACAEVGIFNMALVHFWVRSDLRYLLPSSFFMYAKACYTDPLLAGTTFARRKLIITTCLKLLEDPSDLYSYCSAESVGWQREVLGYWMGVEGQRTLLAAVLAMLSCTFGEDANYLREHGALSICCGLLRDAATRVPLLRHDEAKGERVEEKPSDDCHHHRFFETTDIHAIRTTTYVLSVIALFVSLLWEETVPASDRKELPLDDRDEDRGTVKCANNDGDQAFIKDQLLSTLEALHLLTWASSSIIRGASLKAIAAIMTSCTLGEEGRLRCVCSVVNFTSVLRAPREANMSIRLDLVEAAFLSARWLIQRLSVCMPLGAIQAAVYTGSEIAYRASQETTRGHDGVEKECATRQQHGPSLSICMLCCHGGGLQCSSSSRCENVTKGSISCLQGILAQLMCFVTNANHDPCPYVAARAAEVLESLPPFRVYSPFAQPKYLVDKTVPRGARGTTGRNVMKRSFSALRNHAVQLLKSGFNVMGSLPTCAASVFVEHDSRTRDADSDVAVPRDTMLQTAVSYGINSAGEKSTISAFVFSLLGFLDELLLVPPDDDDPRHPFNLKKNSFARIYMHKLRNELRSPAPPIGLVPVADDRGANLSVPFPRQAAPTSGAGALLIDPPINEGGGRHDAMISLPFNYESLGVDFSGTRRACSGTSPGQQLSSSGIHRSVGQVNVMAFHLAERHLVTGTSQGVVQVWSFGVGREPAINAVSSVPFSSTLGPPPSLDYAVISAGSSATPPAVTSGFTQRAMSCFLTSRFCASAVRAWIDPIALARSTPLHNHRLSATQQNMSAPYEKSSGLRNRCKWQRRLWNDHFASWIDNEDRSTVVRNPEAVSGLHFVDAAYRTLLCVVGYSGTVQLFVDFASDAHVKRLTSFTTAGPGSVQLGRSRCLSSYHAPSTLLHVTEESGLISSWDLVSEHKTFKSVGWDELSPVPPSVITSNQSEASSLVVGAGAVYLFDLRASIRPTHVLPGPGAFARSLLCPSAAVKGVYEAPCLHVSFPCRYAHTTAVAYGGQQGVVMLWDDRHLRAPLRHSVVAGGASGSVCHMDVQSYCKNLPTLSVTLDHVFICDALRSSANEGGDILPFSHSAGQPTAAALHPALPLCVVAGGGSLHLFGC